MAGKMTYPAGNMHSTLHLVTILTEFIDALQVGKWIKEQFGLRSNVTAVFMTHAIINDTLGVRNISVALPKYSLDAFWYHRST
jgi:hypothetical protein